MTENDQHVRVNLGVLAAVEKRALVWMARRMPSWVNSDHLTSLGVVGMFLAGLSFAAARYDERFLLAAVPFLAINWFGDSLDGTLARVRNKLRPRYGYYVDHVVDVFGTLFLIGGLGLSGIMSPNVAGGVLVAFLMTFAEIMIATHALGEFRLSFMKFGPTELRILVAIGAVCAMYNPYVHVFGERLLLFDVGGVIGMAGLVTATLASFVRNARTLYAAEPLR